MEKGFAGGKDEQAVAVHLKSALSLIALKTLLSKKLALRTALFHQFIIGWLFWSVVLSFVSLEIKEKFSQRGPYL
ncbi:hypothetical protein [Liquorilactobacillus satsumensis]|nr:hypothetical protein [Liquorilactobacillus satsumensis]MCC7666877.1 hypothetical protein [Liquorilactobacillus satsumensis]MCP9356979.1 hypothetical protein [Liquorilactobacillus satsumensis]MCP9370926.1 hypothetical protein [Liquorilactobacillus satsumensis]